MSEHLNMELCTFASGSSGNCTLVRSEKGAFLLDAGISARQICRGLQALGMSPDGLEGILITHEHSDHIKGLQVLLKQHRLPVYASPATGRQLIYRIAGIEPLLRPVQDGMPFAVGGMTVTPFSTPHDAAGSLGFAFDDGVRKGALVTDLGHVPPNVAKAVCGAELVVLEANYQPEMLQNGPYPPMLQQRILSDHGHLSNEDSGAFACYLARNGTKTLVLGHLSDKNNTPAQALSVVGNMLKQAGFVPGRDIRLEAAPRSTPGPVYRI